MNLANTFNRIKTLFAGDTATKRIRLIDVSEHLRRDLGLHDVNSDRRVIERAGRTEEFVVFGPLTRAP